MIKKARRIAVNPARTRLDEPIHASAETVSLLTGMPVGDILEMLQMEEAEGRFRPRGSRRHKAEQRRVRRFYSVASDSINAVLEATAGLFFSNRKPFYQRIAP